MKNYRKLHTKDIDICLEHPIIFVYNPYGEEYYATEELPFDEFVEDLKDDILDQVEIFYNQNNEYWAMSSNVLGLDDYYFVTRLKTAEDIQIIEELT